MLYTNTMEMKLFLVTLFYCPWLKSSSSISFFYFFLPDLVDKVLSDDDFNGDGYLTYLEYVLARRRSKNNIKKDGQEL